jgi:prepilin-type N-terminal cleavage/methylation domain-containing protein
MSTADPRARRRSEQGLTLIEVVLVLTILGGMSVLTAQSLGAVRDSSNTLATYRRAQRGGDRLAYQVHDLVSTSRKIFVRGITGNDYLSALDLDRQPPAPGSRLPLPEEYEPLGPDSEGVPQTGNILLLASEGDPLTCLADPATSKLLYMDVYRVVCIYPSETGPRVMTVRREAGRDLVVWQSAPYPSYTQVMNIASATERTRVVRALYTVHGCRYLWNPDAAWGSAFYRIDAAGTVSGTADASHLVPEDTTASPGGRLLYTKLQLARTVAGDAVRQSQLTQEDPEDWTPDGFEVKVVGTSSQRKVWFRLVVEGQSVSGRDTAHPTTLIAALRDL